MCRGPTRATTDGDASRKEAAAPGEGTACESRMTLARPEEGGAAMPITYSGISASRTRFGLLRDWNVRACARVRIHSGWTLKDPSNPCRAHAIMCRTCPCSLSCCPRVCGYILADCSPERATVPRAMLACVCLCSHARARLFVCEVCVSCVGVCVRDCQCMFAVSFARACVEG